MQSELKRRVKAIGASATAGLGSVFVALADRRLNENGRLAFVLPAALASGEAWANTRKLIADRYHLETVVASHDSERPNFSENTSLSELLFIARKRASKEVAGRTTYINLWRNPRSIHEAIDLANRITQIGVPVTIEGTGLTTIQGTSGKLGERSLVSHTLRKRKTGQVLCSRRPNCYELAGAYRKEKFGFPVIQRVTIFGRAD